MGEPTAKQLKLWHGRAKKLLVDANDLYTAVSEQLGLDDRRLVPLAGAALTGAHVLERAIEKRLT